VTTPAAELYFGGSFDPIHMGHLFAAQEAADAVGAQRVLFVPTGRNPLKPDNHSAAPEHRLAMVRRAIEGNSRFLVHDIELEEKGASYTERTVRALVDRGTLVPRPGLIIGDDLVAELHRWRNVDALMAMVRLVLVTRHGVDLSALPVSAAQDVVVVRNPEIPVSSSAVRDRLREGRSVRYLVPEHVYEYIREHRLYQHD